ncbi:MFS transporter [Nocardioides carbamazepini]|uniref:MFS transporter n=1 Tax=Nocardioides carbamazepini TaxID=2854259 RepID=UPI00214A6F3A|nr:MFS transporter [Nocardioides carbamazepini]MCR1781994.1 MFS transporter [Nocardioides carbamazepini]
MPVPSTTPETSDASEISETTGWRPLVACCLGTFLLMAYTAVLTVALPAIGADLRAGVGALQWVVNSYPVALAGLLLGAGSIGDAFGTQRVYVIGVAGFTGATLVAGLAPDVAWLIAGRTAQGVAGALMFGCIPALIGTVYTEARRRALAFAIWGAVAGASSAVGTVAGGLLTGLLGWRWLFLAALPFCALSLLLISGLRLSPSDRGHAPASPVKVDWAGTALATTAVTGLAYAVARLGSTTARDAQVLGSVAVAALALAGLVAVERAAAHPVLPPGILRSRRFVAVLVTSFAYYFATFGALPGIATWLQVSVGIAAFPVSLLLVVQLGAFIAASGLLSPRLRRTRASWTLGATTLAIGVAAASGTCVALDLGWAGLLPFLVVSGLAAGVVSPALPILTLEAAPQGSEAAATSAVNAVRQLGLAVGVAVCSSLTARPDAASAARALGACAVVAILAGAAVVVLLLDRWTGAPGGSRTHT